jgi:transcriptional regulator with XRE-family HTH domain
MAWDEHSEWRLVPFRTVYRYRYTLNVNVVREIRERSGLTTSELARRAATSRPNVTAYEHDRQQPTWPVVQRLAIAAGCAISVTGPVRRPETERSRRLGIAVAAKLVADPDTVLAKGRAGLARLRTHHPAGRSGPWLDRWEELLNGPIDAIIDVLVGISDDDHDLRQNNPFTGVLTDTERRAVLANAPRVR